MEDLSYLLPFCTEKQAEAVRAVMKYGSSRKVKAAIGVDDSLIRQSVRGAKKKAAAAGICPEADMVKPVAPGYAVKGTSTLYDEDGNVKAQWVKTRKEDEDNAEALRAFAEELASDCKGKSPVIKTPTHCNKDLLVWYPVADHHFGMYAYAKECGEDYDTDIAEQVLVGAVQNIVDRAPAADTAVVCCLGDYFHADDESNQTAASGNVLDVDTRWGRNLQVGLRAFKTTIILALGKHKRVHVIMERGNHSPHSEYALVLMLNEYFANNKRVTFDLSPALHHHYVFGKNLICTHHGHKTAKKDLPGYVAASLPKEWGESEYRYCHTGHIHHISRQEFPGMIVESFRTLAAKDAWHASKGYCSGREMVAISYHKEYGEDTRITCPVRRL